MLGYSRFERAAKTTNKTPQIIAKSRRGMIALPDDMGTSSTVVSWKTAHSPTFPNPSTTSTVTFGKQHVEAYDPITDPFVPSRNGSSEQFPLPYETFGRIIEIPLWRSRASNSIDQTSEEQFKKPRRVSLQDPSRRVTSQVGEMRSTSCGPKNET